MARTLENPAVNLEALDLAHMFHPNTNLAALRNGTHDERLGEFADVIAWLTTMANVVGVDLTEAVARKYGAGCPGCNQFVCVCADAEKP